MQQKNPWGLQRRERSQLTGSTPQTSLCARQAAGRREEKEKSETKRGVRAGVLRTQREDAGRREEDSARAGKAPGPARAPYPARGLSSSTVFQSCPRAMQPRCRWDPGETQCSWEGDRKERPGWEGGGQGYSWEQGWVRKAANPRPFLRPDQKRRTRLPRRPPTTKLSGVQHRRQRTMDRCKRETDCAKKLSAEGALGTVQHDPSPPHTT